MKKGGEEKLSRRYPSQWLGKYGPRLDKIRRGQDYPPASFSPDIRDVIPVPQLGNTTGEHHGEQVQEQRPTVPHLHERILTQLLKPAHMHYMLICTVEPLNKGHLRTRYFVLCIEVVLFQR